MSIQKELKITERDTTLNPRQLRSAGFLPGTIYGKGVASKNIQVKIYDFTRALAVGATEFKLVGPGFDLVAHIKNLQTEAVGQKMLNVEFMEVGSKTAASKKPAAEKAPAKKAQPAAAKPAAEEATTEEKQEALTSA